MEPEAAVIVPSKSRVKATLKVGSEVYSIVKTDGTLSEQICMMKEESMNILKDFITKHNVPSNVPDEPLEGSSEDDVGELEKTPEKTKKRK